MACGASEAGRRKAGQENSKGISEEKIEWM
jgi:hypothetical protein